jgi:hypothetical protein
MTAPDVDQVEVTDPTQPLYGHEGLKGAIAAVLHGAAWQRWVSPHVER